MREHAAFKWTVQQIDLLRYEAYVYLGPCTVRNADRCSGGSSGGGGEGDASPTSI